MRVVVDDPFDARLLDRLQTDLPLVPRPWAALADALDSDEATVLERVRALREARVVRQVSAIFDTRRLGYKGMLVAARTPREQQDTAAAVFSAHPGVTHNYEREHDFNLWFTLTVGPDSKIGLERSVALLGELAGVESIRPMPALRFFKIGVDLDVKGNRDPAAKLVKARPVRKSPPPEALELMSDPGVGPTLPYPGADLVEVRAQGFTRNGRSGRLAHSAGWPPRPGRRG